MKLKALAVLAVIATSSMMLVGCGSKGEVKAENTAGSAVLKIGASLSLTGALAREGQLTKEGYQLCQTKVNADGGITVDGKKTTLDIQYQDDTSKPDVAGQLVDQFNDDGIKLILGSYGSANTAAQASVIERNGQVMVDSAGADNEIFNKGYKRTFAVLSPATEYAAAIVKAIDELATPRPTSVVFLSADDGFSKTVTQGGMDAAKKLGFTVMDPEYFPNGTSDVSSSLTKVKGNNPDVIIGSVHLVEGVAIVKQAKELGVTPAGFGESVAPPTPDFAKSLGPLAENVLGSSQWTEVHRRRGQVLRYRQGLRQGHQGQVRPRSRLPQRGSQRSLPGPCARGAEGRLVRRRQGARRGCGARHRVVLRQDQVRRHRAEHLQADVGHPGAEWCSSDGLAEGIRRSEVDLARTQVSGVIPSGHRLRPAPGRTLGARRRRVLPGLGRHEHRQPRPRLLRDPRRLRGVATEPVTGAGSLPRHVRGGGGDVRPRLRAAALPHQPRRQRPHLHYPVAHVRH